MGTRVCVREAKCRTEVRLSALIERTDRHISLSLPDCVKEEKRVRGFSRLLIQGGKEKVDEGTEVDR